MRKNAPEALFSTVRRKVLAALLLHPKKSWYLSELARHIGAAASHLHRELNDLVEAGILTREVEGRQTYFEANPVCPFLPELTELLRKLVGAPSVLAQALRPLHGTIQSAFIYGSVAKGTESAESDIDLMVIGDLSVGDLIPTIRRAEKSLGRPVNPTVYPPSELARKYKDGHHFIRSVMKDPAKIFVIGSARDLEAAASGKAHQDASDEQGRARRAPRRRRRQAQ
jgi:predicted nucleotidyltransferase